MSSGSIVPPTSQIRPTANVELGSNAISELPACGISPAVACPARRREAGRRHRAAPAAVADVEGMGLCRLYVHVDRGISGALSRRRQTLVSAARRIDCGTDRFVRHALLRSTHLRGRAAVVAPANETPI